MGKISIFILSAFFSFKAFASDAGASATLQVDALASPTLQADIVTSATVLEEVKPAPSLAIKMLKEDLEKSVKKTTNTINVYHYFNITSWHQWLDTTEGRTRYLQWYFNGVVSRVRDLNFEQTKYVNAGVGLYAAIDPHISKQFGNAVMEISIPKDTSYLNLVSNVKVRAETIKIALKDELIDKADVAALLVKSGAFYLINRDTFKEMNQIKHSKFRKWITDVLVESEIALLEYNWNSSVGGFCKKQSTSAFVFIGLPEKNKQYDQVDGFKKTLIYNTALPNLNEEEKSADERVKKMRELLSLSISAQRAKLNSGTYFTKEQLAEIKSTTYSCEK